MHDLICTSSNFATELMRHFDWFSSVPDSVIKQLIPALEPYFFAPRENHAVGMAFGAKIAGKMPCVLMQNSGLGLALDAIMGLFMLYKQGLLLIVSNRGELEWEEIQHRDWGRITIPILQAAGLTIMDFEREGPQSLAKASELIENDNKIVVLLLHRGNLDE
jgi:phosphonopyruvate decarboxylase